MKRLNDKEKAFVAELGALMEKHGVYLTASDEYDGDEIYVGTAHEMISETGISLPLSDLTELLPSK